VIQRTRLFFHATLLKIRGNIALVTNQNLWFFVIVFHGSCWHVEVRFFIRIWCEKFYTWNCKRLEKWEHFCNQNPMHLDRTPCHQNHLIFLYKNGCNLFHTWQRKTVQLQISALKFFPKKLKSVGSFQQYADVNTTISLN